MLVAGERFVVSSRPGGRSAFEGKGRGRESRKQLLAIRIASKQGRKRGGKAQKGGETDEGLSMGMKHGHLQHGLLAPFPWVRPTPVRVHQCSSRRAVHILFLA